MIGFYFQSSANENNSAILWLQNLEVTHIRYSQSGGFFFNGWFYINSDTLKSFQLRAKNWGIFIHQNHLGHDLSLIPYDIGILHSTIFVLWVHSKPFNFTNRPRIHGHSNDFHLPNLFILHHIRIKEPNKT